MPISFHLKVSIKLANMGRTDVNTRKSVAKSMTAFIGRTQFSYQKIIAQLRTALNKATSR